MNTARPATGRMAVITFACLALSVVFFAPHLWLMRHYVPGSFEWDRAHTFLLQCAEPFRRDIEPAMLWRLLPPLVARHLLLPGLTPLVLPWLGVVAATAYTAVVLRRQLDDWRFVAGGTLLFTTTSAVLAPVGWLGLNDAWAWLGLLVVAFGRSRWSPVVACLLCPWIDERFIIGLPLAWFCSWSRQRDAGWRSLPAVLGLAPYFFLRLWLGSRDVAAMSATQNYIATSIGSVTVLLPFVPLGWWMGLRLAWFAIGYMCGVLPAPQRLVAIVLVVGTAGILVFLASDLSRSIAILIPAVIWGCLAYAARKPATAPRVLLIAGVANLLIPAAHVTYNKTAPISPLPVELYRLWRAK